MKYCIYLRKSRADAEAESRGEGETLARHEAALNDLAKRQGLIIDKIYREIVSGETIAARPVIQQLLSEVGQGMWAGVLVMEVERLARGDTIDKGIIAQTFKFTGTKIITPMKIYDPDNEFDEEYFEFGLFMSRREYKTINRRLQRGRLASVQEGKYVASQPPYGYKRKKIENEKGYTLESVPEQAEIVRKIFEYYTIGEEQPGSTPKRLGINLIARRLNVQDIPPSKGDTWSAVSVRDILINPVYIGKLRWNWRPTIKKIVDGEIKIERPRSMEKCILSQGRHDPIISEDLFNAAQQIISNNPRKSLTERKKVMNPLCGLVICGECGQSMVRRTHYKKFNRPDTLMCVNPACHNISSSLPLVEDRIVKALELWLQGYTLKWDSIEPGNNRRLELLKKSLNKTDAELNALNLQMNNIHDLLEQGIYDLAKFQERRQNITERIEQVQETRDSILADLKAKQENKNKNYIPGVDSMFEVYALLPTPKAKYDLLNGVLEKVVYFKDKNGRWHNSPDEFEIVIYPKLPQYRDLSEVSF